MVSFLARTNSLARLLISRRPTILSSSIEPRLAVLPVTAALLCVMASTDSTDKWKSVQNIYEFEVNDIDGKAVSLEAYRGKVCLIVNVASKWGLTDKNYNQLVQLDTAYQEKGLRILVFPCNQFGGQEPGSNAEIRDGVNSKYGPKFDIFAKIEVNGANAHPLYKYLQNKQQGTLWNRIKWNFSKFLINKEGVPVKRYSPTTDPMSIAQDIEKEL